MVQKHSISRSKLVVSFLSLLSLFSIFTNHFALLSSLLSIDVRLLTPSPQSFSSPPPFIFTSLYQGLLYLYPSLAQCFLRSFYLQISFSYLVVLFMFSILLIFSCSPVSHLSLSLSHCLNMLSIATSLHIFSSLFVHLILFHDWRSHDSACHASPCNSGLYRQVAFCICQTFFPS